MSDQTRKLAAIVFTDLAGFSELSSSDENLAIELINTQRDIIQPLINAYNGTLHKETGDGFLLTFPTATSAIEFSIDFQRAVKHIDGLNIRIGIHEGEITARGGDVFGDDVNICARIEPYSPVGGIAISEKVKLELGSLPEYQTEFIGEPELKGIKQSIKIYCISSHGLVSSFKITDDSAVFKDKVRLRFNVLSLTGIVLMIIGGAFWVWYGLGDFTHGSGDDLTGGIKKSIAVFNFDNLTGQKEGNFDCAGITESIRSVLTKIGKLDVRDRRSSIYNNATDLDIDFSIQGTLSELGERKNLTVSLVNAKSGSNLFSNQYQFNDEQIVALPDTIIQHILTELKIVPVGNDLTSSVHTYKNSGNFKLIGEGIYHFDNKNYSGAIKAFDSVLDADPGNIVASYHRANSYFELDNFKEAMIIYKGLLGQSADINPIQLSIPVPEKKDMNPILCENIKFIEEKDLAIMLLRGDKSSRLLFINTVSGNIDRDIPIDDQVDSDPVIINNTVFLTSSRIKTEQVGQPTLYAYNISNGRKIFIKEFPRDNNKQSVLFTILEEYNNKYDDNSSILLSFNKLGYVGENRRELILIKTSDGSTLWRAKIETEWGFWGEVVLINSGNTELLLLILEKDIIALNNKTGTEMWRENFSSSVIFSWNQKILEINQDEKYIAIWDPASRKVVWKSHDERKHRYNPMVGIGELKRRMNGNVVLLNFTNGDLVAVNYDGGLLNWNRERWNINVGIAEKIWFPENISNHVFCLTDEGTLLTINVANGNISNRLATDGQNYNVYYDNSKNAMVLNSAEFLVGVDPINGNQLWKIKDSGVDGVGLVGNSILAAKTVLEDSQLIIRNYNRDNGNLIWSENINISASLGYLPAIGTMCGSPDCAFCGDFTFYLEQYSDTSLLLVMPDKIIKVGAIHSGESSVQKKDVQIQIARIYAKNGQLEEAIKEYNLLINVHDQMNKYAYWELATIYQKKNRLNDAAKSLISYYDLILPESSEGAITIQKLRDMHILKWEKNIFNNRFDVAKIVADNEKVFLFIKNNIEAHSIHTSALIWQGLVGDENTSIVSVDVKNEKYIFFIKKDMPDEKIFYLNDILAKRRIDFEAFEKASKYSLAAVDKRVGNVSWDVPLEISGESDITWMDVKSNKIFIQSRVSNKMFVSAYNITGGDLIWKISHDISRFYTAYDLSPAFYKDILLLPLANSIEYINVENGTVDKRYSNEDVDHIYSFNQNSIYNNTMNFVMEDISEYEYVVVDLDKNITLSGGLLDLDDPGLGMWINNIFIDLTTSGSVTAYKFYPDKDNEMSLFWQKNYNTPLKFVGSDKQKIYLLGIESEQIIVVDIQSGTMLQSKPLLWPGKNVEMTNHNFIVQSANKLFVIPR